MPNSPHIRHEEALLAWLSERPKDKLAEDAAILAFRAALRSLVGLAEAGWDDRQIHEGLILHSFRSIIIARQALRKKSILLEIAATSRFPEIELDVVSYRSAIAEAARLASLVHFVPDVNVARCAARAVESAAFAHYAHGSVNEFWQSVSADASKIEKNGSISLFMDLLWYPLEPLWWKSALDQLRRLLYEKGEWNFLWTWLFAELNAVSFMGSPHVNRNNFERRMATGDGRPEFWSREPDDIVAEIAGWVNAENTPAIEESGPDNPFVFVSYASPERERIRDFHSFFRSQKIPLWWDQDTPPGAEWRQYNAEKQLAANAVVTFWTASSAASTMVIEEASNAQKLRKLVHIRLDDTELPYGFAETQWVDLRKWDGTANHPEMRKLLQALRDKLVPPDSEAMAARLQAASPIDMAAENGRLVPKDTPLNATPAIINAADLAARIEGLKQSIGNLRSRFEDRGTYQLPNQFDHCLQAVEQVLNAERLSWYGIADCRHSLIVCLDEHDAQGAWSSIVYQGAVRICDRLNELQPLLQPQQIPIDHPNAKPPVPDPIVLEGQVRELKNLAREVEAIAASPEAKETLAPATEELFLQETARIENVDAQQNSDKKLAHLRRAVVRLVFVVGSIIGAISKDVVAKLLTSPDAAFTLAERLKIIRDFLLSYFLKP